ncbi:MAG: efflux RND transporter permease subunit [Deltaproteobacteria bacterium]|nr:efflux RND transporter permease subunit [Deltaproteobacteria bacterium]
MRTPTDLAVRRKVATGAVFCALVVLGALSFLRLPVDFLPNIAYPLIKVHVWWRGATPEEIEEHVAEVIEREVASVEGLDYLESSSIEGGYTLQVNFRYGVDVNVAFQDTQAAMARAARMLPPDMDPPVIIKADPQQLPVVQLTVQSAQWDLVQIRDWAEDWLLDRVLAVPGVSGAEIAGGLKREIRIHIDPLALEKHRLSVTDIQRALARANVEMFGGRIHAGSRELIARTLGELASLEEIRALPLDHHGIAKITLQDIAEVEDAHEEVRLVTRLDSKPCVKLSVQKQPDANTIEVEEALGRRMEKLAASIPEHIEIGRVESQAAYVQSALSGVETAAFEAALLVILVSILFLGSLRQALVLMTALPITLVINFSLMWLGGFSINIFTLAGIVISLGVLLDNAIVVLENISRQREERDSDPERGAVSATHQVAGAVLAGSLALIALFVPYVLVSGLTSILFRELILVVAGVVLVSLACSLTLVPMLGSVLLRKRGAGSTSRWQAWLRSGYGRSVRICLRGRYAVIPVFLSVVVLAALVVPSLGSEFLPDLDDGRIMIKVKLPTGTSLVETDRLLTRIEDELRGDPLIESAFTLAGGKVWGLYTFEVANEGEIDIQLVPHAARNRSTKAIMGRMKKRLAKLAPPGGNVMVRKMRVKGIRKMGESDIEIQLRGPDLEELYALAGKAVRVAQASPMLANVHLGMDLTKPELLVRIDRTLAHELGVSVFDVATTLRALLHGVVATRYQEGEEHINIRLRIPEERLRSQRDVEDLVIPAADGRHVRLRDLAEVVEGCGPVEIVRENQVKQVVVRADAWGASVGEALGALSAELGELPLPAGYEIDYGGKARLMKDLTEMTFGILGLAVFLAMVVLAVQFNTLRYPLLILSCLPISASGMVFALWSSQLAMGATVLVGLLVVVAATVNDGVLLFTLADELRAGERGISAGEAVESAARTRLRPRVMTTATTIAGLLPLALNIGAGGDMLQPMAVGAIGGLLVEIPVALFLMPCLYVIGSRARRKASL